MYSIGNDFSNIFSKKIPPEVRLGREKLKEIFENTLALF